MTVGSRLSRDFWNLLADRWGEAAAIDPRDTRGMKNSYISLVRDVAIIESLAPAADVRDLLDFGCGTGTFLSRLKRVRPDIFSVGVDISRAMLRHALLQDPDLAGALILYDGERLPMRDGSVDAITTGGVLLYFRDDAGFAGICREFARVLRPGGRVIAVEQVRARTRLDADNMKIQRSPEDFRASFESAGLSCLSWRQVRRARFPLVYAIRYGLLPRSLLRSVAKMESRMWDRAPVPRFDYADAVFTFVKPTQM